MLLELAVHVALAVGGMAAFLLADGGRLTIVDCTFTDGDESLRGVVFRGGEVTIAGAAAANRRSAW